MFFVTNLTAQIKVWNNNKTTVGWANQAPSEQFNVNGSMYLVPNGTTLSGGFYFDNYNNTNANGTYNEPILRPLFAKSMWLGNSQFELYRVFATEMYLSNGVIVTSDRNLKTNIRLWNGSALDKVMKLNVYRYDMDASKYENVPEEKMAEVTEASKNKIGFMAQELQDQFPEVVKSIPGTENVGVDYNMMVPVLLEAIKEQQLLIEQLQAKLEALENK